MGNNITATIISCKGDYYKKVSDQVDKLMASTAAKKLYFFADDRKKLEAAEIAELTVEYSEAGPVEGSMEGSIVSPAPGIPAYGSRENDYSSDLNLGQEESGSIMAVSGKCPANYLIALPEYKGT